MTGADSWAAFDMVAARHLAESPVLAALVLDGALRVERTNDAYLRMAGLGASPVGQAFADLIAPDSRAAAGRLVGGLSPPERIAFVGVDGGTFLLRCNAYREGDRLLVMGDTLTLTDNDVLRTMSRLNDEVVNLGRDLARRNQELQQALDQVKRLEGIIPLCMYCKKIQRDDWSWQRLETYISEHSEAMFSHGMCEACEKLHFPDDVASPGS